MVGLYADRSGNLHGFLYSGGTYTTLDAPGSSYGYTNAWGISNSGQVVGYVHSGLGIRDPVSGFLYAGGSYTMLNVPGAYSTIPFGISPSGAQIVGSYKTDPYVGPGFLLSGGTYTTLNYGAVYTEPHGVNDAGQIVGFTDAGSFWSSGGTTTGIRVPGTLDPIDTSAWGINDAGQIVGEYSPVQGGDSGFLLSGGNYTTLYVPGSLDTYAYGINDAGDIVGVYIDANRNDHGFLATPTPQPSTLVLLGIATLGLLGWAWRRGKKSLQHGASQHRAQSDELLLR
jgi:uncharacterized membrane protein